MTKRVPVVESFPVTWQKKLTLTGRLADDAPWTTVVTCAALDTFIVCLLVLASYYGALKVFITPIERGFSCSDTSIQNPLYHNTVSTTSLLVITLLGPLPLVLFSESTTPAGSLSPLALHSAYEAVGSDILRSSAHVYLDFVIAYGGMTCILEVIKCAVGRLRPNFIAMCNPDKLSLCTTDGEAFVSDFTCQSATKYARNARMSFPSGHAAASAFACLFVLYFVGRRRHRDDSIIAGCRYAAAAYYVYFTVSCCISRVTDYWHFASDVACGVIIAAALFYAFLSKYVGPLPKSSPAVSPSSTPSHKSKKSQMSH